MSRCSQETNAAMVHPGLTRRTLLSIIAQRKQEVRDEDAYEANGEVR